MTNIAASPGSNFHFPSTSYRHTKSAQLVQIDNTIKNCNAEKKLPIIITEDE